MNIRNIVFSIVLGSCLCIVCADAQADSTPVFSISERIVQGDSVMYVLVLTNSLDHAIAYSGWRHSGDLFEDKVEIRAVKRLDKGTWREMTICSSVTHSERRTLELKPGQAAKATHVANVRDTSQVGISYWILPPPSTTIAKTNSPMPRVSQSPILLWSPVLSTKEETPNQTNGH